MTSKPQPHIVNNSMILFKGGCEFLSAPLDIVRSLHNAFRRDIFQIDDAVFKITRGGGGSNFHFGSASYYGRGSGLSR